MAEMKGSRRAFLGSAVAGVAVLGTVAWMSRGTHGIAAPGFGGVVETPGGTPAATMPAGHLSAEIAQWSAAIGKEVRVANGAAGTVGVVERVLDLPARGERPANLRQHPFMVTFLVDRVVSLGDSDLYRVFAPVEGLTELFMTRGGDRGGKATLMAIFD